MGTSDHRDLENRGTNTHAQLDAALASGGTAKVQLDYSASTDVLSAAAITAATPLDVIANQSFTIDGASSSVLVTVQAGAQFTNGAVAASAVSLRTVIDSAGTPLTNTLDFNVVEVSNPCGVGGGAFCLAAGALAAGAHTIKAQLYSTQTGTVWVRASTGAAWGEGLHIQVVELKH